jgi:hypothetical protein
MPPPSPTLTSTTACGAYPLPPRTNKFSGYEVTAPNTTANYYTTLAGSNVVGAMFPSVADGSLATFLPAVGNRSSSTGAVTNQGPDGYYWSSAPVSATYGSNLGFGSNIVNPVNGNNYPNGFSIRCVRQ